MKPLKSDEETQAKPDVPRAILAVFLAMAAPAFVVGPPWRKLIAPISSPLTRRLETIRRPIHGSPNALS